MRTSLLPDKGFIPSREIPYIRDIWATSGRGSVPEMREPIQFVEAARLRPTFAFQPHSRGSFWAMSQYQGEAMMDLQTCVRGLREQAGHLRKQKAQLEKYKVRSFSRWGREPQVETTQWWRSELDRRSNELDDIASRIEDGRPI